MPQTIRNTGEDIRERILAAATHLFARDGYGPTSIQAIAVKVGLRKQSLMHHFPTKLALRAAVMDRLMAHWNLALPRLLVATSDPRERIDVILQAVMDFFTEDRDRARLLLRELLDRPEEMRAFLRERSRVWLTAISATIEVGKAEGRVTPAVDPDAYIAFLAHAMVTGAACTPSLGALMRVEDDAEVHERFIQQLFRLGRAGLYWDALPRDA